MKKCFNPECSGHTSNPKYCSRTCAATVNNKKYPKKKSTRTCSGCGNLTGASTVYFCNEECRQFKDDRLIAAKVYTRVRRTPANDLKIYRNWENGDLTGLLKSNGCLSYLSRDLLLRVLGAKCSVCGWDEINPVSMRPTVTVDHIDGDALNNELSNLKILCPNHHSLTPTYGALNMASMREKAGLTPLGREFARFGRQRLKE